MNSAPENYLTDHSVRSWLLTTDHKRIGILYLLSIVVYFAIAAVAAALMRIDLLTPRGNLVLPETYNKLFTLHGVLMVWFFLIPSIPAVLGNFVIPMMIGARDVAFPKLNLISWYLFNIGGLCALYAVLGGGVDTGWTFYTPYSTTYANGHVVTMIMGVFIAGFGSILTGLNFIITIHKMRAPGMTWFRLPLFIWSLYSTSLILVLATPVLAITLLAISVERLWGVGIFDPNLGGDPVLFQHMFWFYSHPAVYIMILPGMGVISELITCFSRKQVFGYHFVAFSSLAIAIVGFLVWGHHMFVSSQSVYAGMVFSVLSFIVAVPSAIKVFNWTATLYKGSVSYDTPMLYAFGFIGLFTIGGLTGLFLAAIAVDVHLHDTYFVVAHFHYIMVGGMVLSFMGGLHYWWPKITGRMYPEMMGRIAALVTFIGFNLTFFPQFLLGYLGQPRRYHAYPPEFQVFHVLSTAGASILGIGYLMPLFYFLWSLKFGKRAPANPWQATGLEWRTTSPQARDNFPEIPIVTEEPYHYDPKPKTRNPNRNMPEPATAHAHQFETLEQQRDADTLGMWTFLATEVLFFGGLIMCYTFGRFTYPQAFEEASHRLYVAYGGPNTAILLCSSFTMALAVRFAQLGRRKALVGFLIATILFGLGFLVVKGFEYHTDYVEQLVPRWHFHWEGAQAAHAELFFWLYFVLTGLHALHVTIGVVILTIVAILGWQGRITAEKHMTAEITGLYWHFVDIVWVFLFPLLYLIGHR